VREGALKTLGMFKRSDDDVLWGIRHKIQHGPAYARASAVRALPFITDKGDTKFYDKTLQLMLQQLEDPEPTVRDAVVTICPAQLAHGEHRSIAFVFQVLKTQTLNPEP
jgi:hypothetical protein